MKDTLTANAPKARIKDLSSRVLYILFSIHDRGVSLVLTNAKYLAQALNTVLKY